MRVHLFEVPAAGGTERAIPLDPATRIYSMGTIGDAGVMLVPLMGTDFWFNPLAVLAGPQRSDLDVHARE